jgi:hypothetical protein
VDQPQGTAVEHNDAARSYASLAGALIEEADAIAAEFEALQRRTHRWRVAVHTIGMNSANNPDRTAPSA